MVGVVVDTYALAGITTFSELQRSEYQRSEKSRGAVYCTEIILGFSNSD